MSGDSSTDTTSNVEQHISNERKRSNPVQAFHSPVRITIHSIRKRLADSDGISGKAAIDGIVKAGILEDDSPTYVEKVSFTQEKGKDEKTIIQIEVDPNVC